MKLSLMTYLLFTAVLLSCGVKRHSTESAGSATSTAVKMPLQPEQLTGNFSVFLHGNKKDSLESSWTYAFYADTKLPYKDSVNQVIATFMHYTVHPEDSPFTRTELTHNRVHSFLYAFENEFKYAQQVYQDNVLWQCNLTVSIEDLNADFVQVHLFRSLFTGGAHGLSHTEHFLFSKADGSVLALKEVVKETNSLKVLGEKAFRRAVGVPLGDDLPTHGYWFEGGEFYNSERFFITNQGIEFVFNPYDVAPYSFGTLTYTIPWNELEGLLLVQGLKKNP